MGTQGVGSKPTGGPRVGISGTGFIGSGVARALSRDGFFPLGGVLTRRSPAAVRDFPLPEALTDSLEEFLDGSDLIVECSGDPIHATEVVDRAMDRGLPVVTMNAEFQVTTGSWFADRGVITEAEGDQPGCLAALNEEARCMGFRPRVYGNRKGFLNEDPDLDTMRYWARKQGISLEQVTAATDGTKIQVEQTLVANGLGAGMATPGLLGPACDQLDEGAMLLAREALKHAQPIADYVLCPSAKASVFIVAEHDSDERPALRYFRLGDGPAYMLERNHNLCHLEVLKTLRRLDAGGGVLINNSSRPRFSVGAVAKRPLEAGERIARGLGSFEVRGCTVPIGADHLPIGLLSDAVLTRRVERGAMLGFDDVELAESLALRAWRDIRARHDRGGARAHRADLLSGGPADRVSS